MFRECRVAVGGGAMRGVVRMENNAYLCGEICDAALA